MKIFVFLSLVIASCAHKAKLPDPATAFKEGIRSAIKAHMAEFGRCYGVALKRDSKIAGKIDTAWTITSTGDIKDARIVDSTVGDQRFETCVVNTLWSIKFPPPTANQVADVKYPFVFGATGGLPVSEKKDEDSIKF